MCCGDSVGTSTAGPDTAAAEYLAVRRLQADAFITIDEQMAARADGIATVAPLAVLTA